MPQHDYDAIIVGSGFGGSTAALRLVEKGYRVLMLEKGSELRAEDFPETNWDLPRWMWSPSIGWRGLFRLTFFRHVTILSGVGVGGGSLGYACTHPVPSDAFFESESWRDLADWKHELAPHYDTAKHMLGVTTTPMLTPPDRILKKMAEANGQADAFRSTEVAVYFGEPGRTDADPYFGGDGPSRTGCVRCGGCMLGCRHNAKNSLDKNYLYFARQRGLELWADSEARSIKPLPGGGYEVHLEVHRGDRQGPVVCTASKVIVSAGVLGTVDLLLKQREDRDALPKLSPRLGYGVRTNNESLICVVAPDTTTDMSKGIAIGSIYETDEHSHLEPVRYPEGSGFFRVMMMPHVGGQNPFLRLVRLITVCWKNPLGILKALLVRNYAKRSAFLLYMRTSESTLRLKRNWLGWLSTTKDQGDAPNASIPEATALAHQFAREVDGTTMSGFTETLFNIPSTAHILGGCCIGATAEDGVIDANHEVHGYPGLFVMDGSAMSANPGVNPSLTIVAMTERAIAKFPNARAADREERSEARATA